MYIVRVLRTKSALALFDSGVSPSVTACLATCTVFGIRPLSPCLRLYLKPIKINREFISKLNEEKGRESFGVETRLLLRRDIDVCVRSCWRDTRRCRRYVGVNDERLETIVISVDQCQR